jgi:hypothetical protein
MRRIEAPNRHDHSSGRIVPLWKQKTALRPSDGLRPSRRVAVVRINDAFANQQAAPITSSF